MKITIGERLEDLIKEKGVSYETVGKSVGLSKATISNIISGTKDNIKRENIEAICDYFNVTTDYLLGRSDVRSPSVEYQKIQEKTHLSAYGIDSFLKFLSLKNEEYMQRETDGNIETDMIDVVNAILSNHATYEIILPNLYLYFENSIQNNHKWELTEKATNTRYSLSDSMSDDVLIAYIKDGLDKIRKTSVFELKAIQMELDKNKFELKECMSLYENAKDNEEAQKIMKRCTFLQQMIEYNKDRYERAYIKLMQTNQVG